MIDPRTRAVLIATYESYLYEMRSQIDLQISSISLSILQRIQYLESSFHIIILNDLTKRTQELPMGELNTTWVACTPLLETQKVVDRKLQELAAIINNLMQIETLIHSNFAPPCYSVISHAEFSSITQKDRDITAGRIIFLATNIYKALSDYRSLTQRM